MRGIGLAATLAEVGARVVLAARTEAEIEAAPTRSARPEAAPKRWRST